MSSEKSIKCERRASSLALSGCGGIHGSHCAYEQPLSECDEHDRTQPAYSVPTPTGHGGYGARKPTVCGLSMSYDKPPPLLGRGWLQHSGQTQTLGQL